MTGIEPGMLLDAYDDGKCSPSRHAVVEVVSATNICAVSEKFLHKWRNAIYDDFGESLLDCSVHYCHGPQRCWDWNCDEFIFAKFPHDKETEQEPIMFARRGWGGWYGVNYNYMLDLNGKVREENWEVWQACAKEAGQELKWNAKAHRLEYYKDGKLVEIC